MSYSIQRGSAEFCRVGSRLGQLPQPGIQVRIRLHRLHGVEEGPGLDHHAGLEQFFLGIVAQGEMEAEILAGAIEIELLQHHAAARRGVDDAQKIERLGGFANHRVAHAEPLRHLLFGQQRVARLESLVDDVLAELGGQLLAQPPAPEFGLGRSGHGFSAWMVRVAGTSLDSHNQHIII